MKLSRFLNFGVNHKEYMKVVEKSWMVEIEGYPFTIVCTKLKMAKHALA